MQVLLTIIVIAAVAAWVLTVQQRLERMRRDVKAAWKILEPNQANEAARTVYNRHVTAYNAALESFPANVLGPLTGCKPARPF